MQFGPAAGEVRCRSCHGSIRGRIALLRAGRRKLRNADALPAARRAIGSRRRSIARRAPYVGYSTQQSTKESTSTRSWCNLRGFFRARGYGGSACANIPWSPSCRETPRSETWRLMRPRRPLSSPHPWASIFFRFRIAQFLSVRPRRSGGPVFASSRLALGPPPSRDERPRGPSTHLVPTNTVRSQRRTYCPCRPCRRNMAPSCSIASGGVLPSVLIRSSTSPCSHGSKSSLIFLPRSTKSASAMIC